MQSIIRFPPALPGGDAILSRGRTLMRSPDFTSYGIGVRTLGSQADVVAADEQGFAREGCFIGLPCDRMPSLAACAIDAYAAVGQREHALRGARTAFDAVLASGAPPEAGCEGSLFGDAPAPHRRDVRFPCRLAGRDDIIALGADGTVKVWGVGVLVLGPLAEVVALQRDGAPMTGTVIRLPTHRLPDFAGITLAAYLRRNDTGSRGSAHGRMADRAAVESVLFA